MRSRLPIIAPPWWLIAVPCVPLVGMLIAWSISDLYVWQRFGFLTWDTSLLARLLHQEVRLPFCLWFALMFGAFRAVAFHPAFRPVYRGWLAMTPWTSRLPLPLGPIRWVWQDLWFVAPVTLLAWGPDSRLILAVPVLFAMTYLSCLIVSLFVTGERGIGFGAAFLVLLAIHSGWPEVSDQLSLWPMLVVVAMCYALVWWGLERSLANFLRWNLSGAEAQASGLLAGFAAFHPNRDELVRRQFSNQQGWPFDALRLSRRPRLFSVSEEVIVSLLAAFALHATHVREELVPILQGMLLFFFPLILVISTACFFRPPISLWGRLRTGRLLLPRYDRCFTWPLAMFGLQYAWLRGGNELGWSVLNVAAVQAALLLWCIFRMIAALEAFQFTGSHRIPLPPNVSLAQQAFTSA